MSVSSHHFALPRFGEKFSFGPFSVLVRTNASGKTLLRNAFGNFTRSASTTDAHMMPFCPPVGSATSRFFGALARRSVWRDTKRCWLSLCSLRELVRRPKGRLSQQSCCWRPFDLRRRDTHRASRGYAD